MSKENNMERFSDRVSNYIKYRPDYPQEVIHSLIADYGLQPHSEIADIGAGTGIFSELLLSNGFRVYGVEPNAEMREASADLLSAYSGFKAVAGSAEATLLRDDSVDFITCAQAFHWFKNERVKAEFKRILRPGGKVVVLWNERLVSTPFEQAFEQLIVNHGTDYREVDHRKIDYASLEAFFAPKVCAYSAFTNAQDFDLEGLLGRLLSTSYLPNVGDDGYAALQADATALFSEYAQDNRVTIHYTVKTYVTSV